VIKRHARTPMQVDVETRKRTGQKSSGIILVCGKD
jgi:hypothetical protein